jgi:secreted trypsin-like serine protease
MNENKVQTCGKSSFISGERIIGGRLARNGEFPFVISLQIFGTNFSDNLCGRSIIDKYTILTAAHCVVGFV